MKRHSDHSTWTRLSSSGITTLALAIVAAVVAVGGWLYWRDPLRMSPGGEDDARGQPSLERMSPSEGVAGTRAQVAVQPFSEDRVVVGIVATLVTQEARVLDALCTVRPGTAVHVGKEQKGLVSGSAGGHGRVEVPFTTRVEVGDRLWLRVAGYREVEFTPKSPGLCDLGEVMLVGDAELEVRIRGLVEGVAPFTIYVLREDPGDAPPTVVRAEWNGTGALRVRVPSGESLSVSCLPSRHSVLVYGSLVPVPALRSGEIREVILPLSENRLVVQLQGVAAPAIEGVGIQWRGSSGTGSATTDSEGRVVFLGLRDTHVHLFLVHAEFRVPLIVQGGGEESPVSTRGSRTLSVSPSVPVSAFAPSDPTIEKFAFRLESPPTHAVIAKGGYQVLPAAARDSEDWWFKDQSGRARFLGGVRWEELQPGLLVMPNDLVPQKVVVKWAEPALPGLEFNLVPQALTLAPVALRSPGRDHGIAEVRSGRDSTFYPVLPGAYALMCGMEGWKELILVESAPPVRVGSEEIVVHARPPRMRAGRVRLINWLSIPSHLRPIHGRILGELKPIAEGILAVLWNDDAPPTAVECVVRNAPRMSVPLKRTEEDVWDALFPIQEFGEISWIPLPPLRGGLVLVHRAFVGKNGGSQPLDELGGPSPIQRTAAGIEVVRKNGEAIGVTIWEHPPLRALTDTELVGWKLVGHSGTVSGPELGTSERLIQLGHDWPPTTRILALAPTIAGWQPPARVVGRLSPGYSQLVRIPAAALAVEFIGGDRRVRIEAADWNSGSEVLRVP